MEKIKFKSKHNKVSNNCQIEIKNKKKEYSPNKINPPKAGIPLQSIYNPDESLLTDLKCPICLNLIWNIVELNECGHTFCEYCIDESIKKAGNFCPICKISPITKRNSKTLIRFLNKIKIKCMNPQCQETPEYTDYLSHLEKCEYKLYHCKNKGCNYNYILNDMKNHLNNCKYRIVKCLYCSKCIQEYLLEEHEKKESMELIECDKCKKSMTKGLYYKNHFSNNNENLECLKDQVVFYKNKYNEILKIYKSEINNAQNVINELIDTNTKIDNEINRIKNEKNELVTENNNLKEKLLKWNNSFKKIYDELVDEKEQKNNDNNK